jgi:hypothetical protein
MKNRFIDSLQSEILKKRNINTSSGTCSTISGGRCNTASGSYEVPGGITGLIGIVGHSGAPGWIGIKMTTVSGGY